LHYFFVHHRNPIIEKDSLWVNGSIEPLSFFTVFYGILRGMKILVDIRLLSRGGLSGIEEYTRELISHLLERDSENEYQLFYNQFRNARAPHEWIKKNNVSVINWRIPNRILDLGVKLFRYPKIDRVINTDLIFSPHFNALAIQSTPHILTFHDLSFMHHPYFFNKKRQLWHWFQNYKMQAVRAKYIIANSEFTKNDIVHLLGIPEEKVQVIYPGINRAFKKLKPHSKKLLAFKKKYGITYDYILSLGTLEPRKNIPAVIRSFSLLKRKTQFANLKLIIAGRPGWLYKNILQETNKSLYKKDIIFWGPVENYDRVLLYNLAKAFVYPSFFEGFGFPPLEAQACGCPVIVGDRTSLPEIIDSSGITINPWRIDEFVNALQEVLTDEVLRDSLIGKGLKNTKRFSWKKSAQELHTLLTHGIKKENLYRHQSAGADIKSSSEI
jgi:glycosyltransferase involved in cell wall biosynthesis